ncbi:MAG: methyltransferase domain-containing protein [Chloroflexota bacterium]
MNHHDHVRLLQRGVPQKGGVWADLGSGQGAFTLALAELVGETATIYSVDKNRQALRRQKTAMQAQFSRVTLHTQVADFTRPLSLPLLDGIVMANSLHFVRNKRPLLINLRRYLKENGRLLIVEYNTDRGNMWVPHPFSYSTWETLAANAGFAHTKKLATQPSRFLGEMFSAMSLSS